MNKKIIGLISLVVLISLGVFVSAVLNEINPQNSKSLNSGNGVCEYYQKEFSNGDTETITVNGATFNIGYLGNKNWKVNDYEGKLQNHDFFVYNKNSKLKGVRFDFSYMADYQPEGNFGLTEQDYYPWDCQGYSSSTGLISEIKIQEGWNLVPFDISMRDCYYALSGELCKDDILVSYTYIPSANKYFSQEEIEKQIITNSDLREFFSEDNELTVSKSSKWIYVKPGAGNKKVIGHFGAYIPLRNKYLDSGAFTLKSGWNFLFVDAFMVYDDSWNENPLSLNDMKGNCDIVDAYLWDTQNQQWGTILNLLDDKNILNDEGGIGGGFIVKVSEDCVLGTSTGDGTSPPGLPGGNGDSEIGYLIEEDIFPYTFSQSYGGIYQTELGVSFYHYEAIYSPYAEGNVYVFDNNEDALLYFNNGKQSMDDNEQDYEIEIVEEIEMLRYYVDSNKIFFIWVFEDKVIATREPNQGDNVAEAYFSKYS